MLQRPFSVLSAAPFAARLSSALTLAMLAEATTRMAVRLAASFAASLALCAAAPAWAATLKVTLLVPADDARLARSRLEAGYLGHAGGPSADALKVALAEGALELDAAGAKVELQVLPVADAAQARAAAAKAEQAGAGALVLDLPTAWLLAAADAVKVPVLNVSNGADSLRQADCRRHVWHLAPSDRMRADALAQTLVARRWNQILLLTGPSDADRERSAGVQAAIKRYGLKLVGQKAYKLSADPRERDLANPALLTGTASTSAYDAVWVVDSDGEFAAQLPYRTALPRPVVGDGGLVAVAWSPKFERFGAPQVTRRLTKAVARPMGALDWPAWMAGKALVSAAAAAPKLPAGALAKALAGLELDGSKGVAMAFRAWDGQLRQPLLLTDGQSVVATAPMDGVLHPRNALDSLGADEPEKLCKGRS